MSFEWRTDEDDGWQEEARSKDTAVTSFWRRRWPFFVVVLLGGAIVWASVQWQINQRVSSATEDISIEILNTHNFVLQTAVAQDEVLFKANLSGRDPAWGEVQKALLSEGLMLDRPMLGWQHNSAAQSLTLDKVTLDLSPDLRAAELIYPQTYAVQTPSGLTETVTLQQTAVYRQGDTRWLYSPPYDDEFWGNWLTQGGTYLTVTYPERDRDVAARLGVALNALLDQMCTELNDLNCASDLRVHLRLDTEPDSLLVIDEVETILKAGLRLEMPAPTLIGLPVDEAGYDVLYQAYGVQLATAVLAHQTDYDCCRHQLFFRALRDYQLAQLGLQAWPLDEAMFSSSLSAGFDGQTLSYWTRRWQEAPPQVLQVWVVEDHNVIWPRVYMLIEFLAAQETAVSPAEMMRLMNRNSYHGWMNDALAGDYDQTLFPTLFLEYIYAQSRGGQQAEPPIPFPNGEITVVCANYQTSPDNHVYAFDLASGTWQEKLTHVDLTSSGYIVTQDGEHFILTENEIDDPIITQTFYLITEEERIFLEEVEREIDTEHYTYYYPGNITNARLPQDSFIRYEYDQGRLISMVLRSFDCPTEGCPEIRSVGLPVFTPNGQYFIENVQLETLEGEAQDGARPQYDMYLVSVDGDFRQLIGRGAGSFWLDGERYGLVQAFENGWELALATLSDPELHVLLNESDLLTEITEVSTLLIRNAFVLPHTQSLILDVQTDEGSAEKNRLIRVWLADDLTDVTKIEQLWTGSFAGAVGYSPDGRYIIIAEYNYASSSGEIPYFLLDMETLELSDPILSRTSGYGLNWSPDGQWFIQNTEHYLLLHAPAHEYQYYIPQGFGECQQVVLSVDK